MDLLKQLESFTAEITSSNSRKHKIEVLKKYNDPAFLELLKVLYNPNTVLGVTSAALQYEYSPEEFAAYKDLGLLDLLEKLAAGALTGNAARAACSVYAAQNQAQRDLISKVANCDLKAGINAKTILEAHPKLFSLYKVALATDSHKANVKLDQHWVLERKYDGVRCQVHIHDPENVYAYTRTGNILYSIDHILLEMSKLPPAIYDGELLVVKDGKEDFKAASSYARRLETNTDLHFYVFDCLSQTEFEAGHSTTVYKERLALAAKNVAGLGHVHVVPCWDYSNETKEKLWQVVLAEGWEGLIARKNTTYKNGRSKDLIKLKVFQDDEFEVVGFLPKTQMQLIEGKMQPVECLGKFLISYKGNTVEVGTGFTQEEAKEIWANQSSYLGRKITVQYQGESEDASGKKSLRIPSFKGFR